MNVSIVYSSQSGCTKKVAEALYERLDCETKSIADVKDHPSVDEADLVVFGYRVEKGAIDEKAAEWLTGLKGKRLFLFATLAYPLDTEQGMKTALTGVEKAQASGNELVGYYFCQGRLAQPLIDFFKKTLADGGDPSPFYDEKKGILYEILADHPTEAEIALGAERLNERVEWCHRMDEKK